MEHFKSLFQQLSSEPSPQLEGRVLLALRMERIRSLRNRRRWSLLGVLFSGVVFVGTVAFFGASFIDSEFWSLASLLFSDAQVVFGSSQDYIDSLLETLPLLPLILFLAPLMVLFWSASFLLSFSKQNDRTSFSPLVSAH